MQPLSNKLLIFDDFLKKRRLRKSRQREIIIYEFLKTTHHLSVEELLTRSRKLDVHIGFATVYRTLKLLVAAGLAHERDFNTGRKLYENADVGENHDHLVCLECGAVKEFIDDGIQHAQTRIAQKHDFQIVSYRHELYGFCHECSTKKKN